MFFSKYKKDNKNESEKIRLQKLNEMKISKEKKEDMKSSIPNSSTNWIKFFPLIAHQKPIGTTF